MKKILFVFLSFLLSGELEVDGDLNITVSVEINDEMGRLRFSSG